MPRGIRVLYLTDRRGHLAGKILGELGADVIKIEPPGGDPLRTRGPFVGGEVHPEASIPWLAANTSKRGIVLDLAELAGRADFLELVTVSDVVLESFAPGTMEDWGLDYPSLAAVHPGLVHCAITPFGSTGPRAGWHAHDLTIVAAGGNAALTGDADRAPLTCSAPTAYLHAAPEAVIGILFALHGRARTGRGDFVDVSMQECQLATLLTAPGQVALTGKLRRRVGSKIGRTREIWRARDGWVSFGLCGGAARAPGLRALVELMAEHGAAPEWLRRYEWTRFDPSKIADTELAVLESTFAAFFEDRTMAELYADAVKRRLMLAPCQDAAATLADPQLRARGLFVPVSTGPLGRGRMEVPGTFARTTDCAIGLRCRAPGLGEHESSVWSDVRAARGAARARPSGAAGGPLDTQTGERSAATPLFAGLRILELGAGAAGPVATRYFVEHGAEVIRVESASRPDFIRLLHLGGGASSDVAALDRAPMFALLNAGKKSVALDLTQAEGRSLLGRLAREAEVLIENFTPGVLARWGLAPSTLLDRNRRLIVVSSSLFGQTGPHRDYPGFGGQGAALAGFNHLTGWPDREPIGPYATITDSLAPRFLAAAVAAALLERDRVGTGRILDVSQVETGVYALAAAIAEASARGTSPQRLGNRSLWAAPHGIYPCAGEDRWLALAVWNEREWQTLVAMLGEPAWTHDERFGDVGARLANVEILDQHLAAWTRHHEAATLSERLQGEGIEAVAVADCAALLEDPQLAHRGHFVRVPHAALGELATERCGFRLASAANAAGLFRGGPGLGEHSREVLTAIGIGDEDFARLVEERVVA
ncbi:MAG: CoA transferase [Deltaproteobacteria bacterium]|nr:CoA transferase [Deltaproteobacteria bacterium]